MTVPEGVELRGSSSVPTRGQTGWSKGTLISSVYGMGQPGTDPALVTLSPRSGVSGIRFVYRENGPAAAKTTPFVIRGTGADVYCVNVSIAAAGSACILSLQAAGKGISAWTKAGGALTGSSWTGRL